MQRLKGRLTEPRQEEMTGRLLASHRIVGMKPPLRIKAGHATAWHLAFAGCLRGIMDTRANCGFTALPASIAGESGSKCLLLVEADPSAIGDGV